MGGNHLKFLQWRNREDVWPKQCLSDVKKISTLVLHLDGIKNFTHKLWMLHLRRLRSAWKPEINCFGFKSNLTDAPRGCVSNCWSSRRLHSRWIFLRAANVRRPAPPFKGLSFQQRLQAASIRRSQRFTLQTQLQVSWMYQSNQKKISPLRIASSTDDC